jgi:hypothetical protein
MLSRPQEISVTVPSGYSGEVHVQFCALDGGKPKLEFESDGSGQAKTSFCPKGRLQFTLLRDGKTIALKDSAVQLNRTGDGITTGATLQAP